MKKFLMAAILASSFLISAPQAEAELVYTGYSYYDTYSVGGKQHRCLTKIHVDTDSIRKTQYGFSVNIVYEEVGLRNEALPKNFIYKQGEWRLVIGGSASMSKPKGYDGTTKVDGNDKDKAIWNVVAPYAQKIQAQKDNQVKEMEKAKSEVAPLVEEADAKYKAKNYTEAKELFSQAVAQYPNDYHTHDLFARSMYHEKSKNKNYDKIIAESKKAIELAPDNESKADCYSFLAKVYRKLAMNNLFNMNNKTDYAALGQQCLDKANQLRMAK